MIGGTESFSEHPQSVIELGCSPKQDVLLPATLAILKRGIQAISDYATSHLQWVVNVTLPECTGDGIWRGIPLGNLEMQSVFICGDREDLRQNPRPVRPQYQLPKIIATGSREADPFASNKVRRHTLQALVLCLPPLPCRLAIEADVDNRLSRSVNNTPAQHHLFSMGKVVGRRGLQSSAPGI